MWEPTGKKATDKATGAQLTEVTYSVTGSVRWEVRKDGVLLGVVHSYEGTPTRKLGNTRLVTYLKPRKMWAQQAAKRDGRTQRTHMGYATRGNAVRAIVGY